MHRILLCIVWFSAMTAQIAYSATLPAVPSPAFDALTRGRTPSATTIAAKTAPAKTTTANQTPAAAQAPAPEPAGAIPEKSASPNTTSDSTHSKLYAGAQLGDSIVGGLIGLSINKTYSLEARYDYVDTVYLVNTTTKTSSIGIAGVALFPLKLSSPEPFYIFTKAGYERTTVKAVTKDPGIPGLFPPTTTTATTLKKRVLIGAGIQYDFSTRVSGRVGINFIGNDHSVYLAALYKL